MNAGKIATIGTVPEIKSRTNKENATLEDAFIFFTGAELEDTSNFRSVRQTRRTEHRLG
jgi:ABC-2 type transport system ATP-binding protein